MSIKYVAKQDVFFHTSQAEMYRRHEAIRAMLRENHVGAAVLISRNGAPRSYLRGGRFGGILSGGDGIYSGGDILLADGDMYITGDVDGFTQWAVGHRSPVTPSVEPGVWELAEFDAALILDGFQSAGNRRLGLIYPDMMDIALAEYLQAYVGDYEAVDLTAAFEQLWTKRSPEEIEMERRVVQMHEQVFRAIPAVLHSGMTEHECVSRIRDLFYRNGCGDLTRWIDCWMELRSGTDGTPEEPEQAFPGRVLKKGDRVDIAVHASGENTLYAMCARSFVLADAPEPETAELWNAAVSAQRLAAEQLRPGAVLKSIARQVNELFKAAGLETDDSNFLHAIGYDMEETPCLYDASENMPLQPGMVIAVMPTARKKGLAPMCCGDVFVVTEQGGQRLGNLPQEIVPVYGLY